jgi:hypothetical protein
MFQQQFQAEGSFFVDNNNDELFIINLATVPAESNSNSMPA